MYLAQGPQRSDPREAQTCGPSGSSQALYLWATGLPLLISVKISTIVGILTFISMINTTSERLKARNFFICQYFSFYEQLKIRAQLSWAWKKFYNLGARLVRA